MQPALDWLKEHPLFWELALFPVVTALVTWFLKPRTDVQYAALHPRLAALLKLVAAVGFDAPKILDAISQAVTGKSRTVAEERAKQRGAADVRAIVEGLSILVCVSVAAVVAFALLSGCTPRHAVNNAAHVAAVASYADDLERCLQRSSTCDGYVLCRHEAERKHGQPWSDISCGGGK